MNNQKNNRREFLKMTAISGIGVSMSGHVSPLLSAQMGSSKISTGILSPNNKQSGIFIPRRAASWWCTLEDILWPEKKITDKIKRRAHNFAQAGIDTAINFGFHIRFDYSDYFHQLHGYYRDVCEELHRYNIRFMDHYSCNHTIRPRNEAEFKRVHQRQRHEILLFHDRAAARHAQYEGVLYDDICELDIVDGSRGYTDIYQMEVFCPNNPRFLEMHRKYLSRLLNEVPLDGMEVDDMCDYAGLRTCGCSHCRARLKKEYGREIPPITDKAFWGNTSEKSSFRWGNYESPAFKDWLRMKSASFVDHLKMIKGVIGDRPLMTCVSSSGPIILNGLSLNVERMAPQLNFFMLENVGINIRCVDWVRMDAEALNQKDIALKRGHTAALALSYTIYEKGGYLGWSLARFWGVANWASTLNGRLVEDPPDAMEIEDIVGPCNNWETRYSDLKYQESRDFTEVRLVSSLDCRENGWRNDKGREQWDSVKAWSAYLVQNDTGYRIVRSEELADEKALCSERTPLVLDNLGCVSDAQWEAIKKYLALGGPAWIALPFGVRDEKGIKRKVPLSKLLAKMKHKKLTILPSATTADPLKWLIGKKKFQPALRQVSGDKKWTARIKYYNDKPVIHFLNTALKAVAHPRIKDMSGTPVLKDIQSDSRDNLLVYELDSRLVTLPELAVMSPEWEGRQKKADLRKTGDNITRISVNLDGVKIYAVAQPVEL